MITSKLSQKELIEKCHQQLFQLDSKKLDKKFLDPVHLDEMPTGLQVNSITGRCLFMNKVSRDFLGYDFDEIIGLGHAYAREIMYDEKESTRIINQIKAFYNRNNPNEILGQFQQVKPRGKDGPEWVYVASKLRIKKNNQMPTERLLSVFPVKLMGDMSRKMDKLLDDNLFFRKYFKYFSSLTRREKEILSEVALGNNNPDIAEKLYISRETVAQHRKNIKKKINFKNYYELIKFAETFELI